MSVNNSDTIAMAMDGTPLTDVQIIDNTKYSQEIIDGARSVYNLETLDELKKSDDLTVFYEEVKKQILSQWHADQALNVHSDMFRVQFQINVGNILNVVEPTFKKKSDYTKWIMNNFKNNHVRYFQQAKQLALMGDFARTYAAAGKNRLLMLEHVRDVEKKRECEMLFEDYPLPDTTEDEDGQLLKRQIDSVITLHRLQNAGLRSVTFDQANLVASYNNEAITVNKAVEIKTWMDQQPEEERPALFDRFVQDQMAYPSDHPYTPAPKASLAKVLADLLTCYGTGNLEDEAWIARQRELNILESLLSAQRLIGQLIDRMRTDEPATSATSPAETQASA